MIPHLFSVQFLTCLTPIVTPLLPSLSRGSASSLDAHDHVDDYSGTFGVVRKTKCPYKKEKEKKSRS